MPKLFEPEDLREEPMEEPQTPQKRLYSVGEAGTWEMRFDREAAEDLDRLKRHIPRAESREDVVYTALQILALAVNRDVLIKGKFKGRSKKVSGLWN